MQYECVNPSYVGIKNNDMSDPRDGRGWGGTGVGGGGIKNRDGLFFCMKSSSVMLNKRNSVQ